MERASSAYNLELSKRHMLVLAAAAIAGTGVYIVVAWLTYRIGFPLDDSWIHATYARNLALDGQWAFRLGHPSAGSTAPLWTLLLSPGFWLHIGPLWWSYVLGAAELFALSALMECTMRKLLATYRPTLPWAGLFTAAEWHLLWAAASGMETLLQALLVTIVLVLLVTGSRRYLSLGLLTGLSVWARPDGLSLAGPVLLTILLVEPTLRGRGRAVLLYLIGMGALFLPYLVLNLSLSGTPMPNTFYAKQAEYAAWQSRPFVARALTLLIQLLTGPSILLLPSALVSLVWAIRRGDVRILAAMLWCAAYLLVYISRLPPYQHGRYLMPAMPIFFLFGLRGYFELEPSALFGHLQWLKAGWRLSLVCLTVGFLGLGARAYGQDVGLIETEMVNTAKWVATNLPPNAVIAAHDIGALGYFDSHRLIDLAGLVSPQVIPFLRNESRLAQFLDEQGAGYLVTFPSFYPMLTAGLQRVYSSGGPFAVAMAEQNMVVYCWRCK